MKGPNAYERRDYSNHDTDRTEPRDAEIRGIDTVVVEGNFDWKGLEIDEDVAREYARSQGALWA